MSVSVVIPALNEESRIGACLQSIRAQEIPCELIVIDNGSTDRTPEIAKDYCDKVLIRPHMTIANMRALGVEESSGEIIVSTDADCIAPPNWLEELIKPFQDSDVVLVGGPFRPTNPGLLSRFFCFLSAKSQFFGLYGGANMAFRKTVYQMTLGYANARRAEDWTLSWNLKKTGKTLHVPKAFTRTEVPLNRQLEYPLLIISWILLIIGYHQQWYTLTGFAIGYLGSITTTFYYRYRKSLTLTFIAVISLIAFVFLIDFLDMVNTMYMFGGVVGILAYLFGIEYVRMALEYYNKLSVQSKINLSITEIIKEKLYKMLGIKFKF
jgi:glycosyltransferase involved in cell wall biosynthesis